MPDRNVGCSISRKVCGHGEHAGSTHRGPSWLQFMFEPKTQTTEGPRPMWLILRKYKLPACRWARSLWWYGQKKKKRKDDFLIYFATVFMLMCKDMFFIWNNKAVSPPCNYFVCLAKINNRAASVWCQCGAVEGSHLLSNARENGWEKVYQ